MGRDISMKDTNMKNKATKGKKITLNPAGDQVVIDPEKPEEVKEATAVLSLTQRRQRAISMRRRMPKIKRARELAVKRMAGKSKIKRRSRNLARKYLKRRFAGQLGQSYQTLDPSSKIVVDRIVSSKSGTSRAIASRLVPRVRSAETKRLSGGKRTSTYNIRPITASFEHPDRHLIEAAQQSINQIVNEIKMKGEDPCWKGYEMVGHKKKNGKTVPNCVPVKEGYTKKPAAQKLLDALKRIEARKKPLPPANPDKPK